MSLLGWGFIHLFGDPPYRSFLWSESLMSWLVVGWAGVEWSHWVTSSAVQFWTQWAIRCVGVLLIAGAWFQSQRLLFSASGVLGGVALLLFKESGWQFGQLIEQASQVAAPLLLVLALKGGVREAWLRGAVALTFLGHGLYAAGFYPVPGSFVDMTIGVLGVSEGVARWLLACAGWMDFAGAVGVFVPRAARWALGYACVWGFLTAAARPVFHLGLGNAWSGDLYWFAEFLCRAPHFGIPLVALLHSRGRWPGFIERRSSFSVSTVAGVPTPLQREV
jgi:hypothetical protein